eukprot:TRINITY_DN3220_c0_g7_i1.p2 TRINITY_DN3220_c0_g7~~TRINITY_DN3220_c0_g7_i1.p2  ORF type:complete len:190 (+),score=9.47 TRINITY_DN3220_c0_g7_i1:41-610(+)
MSVFVHELVFFVLIVFISCCQTLQRVPTPVEMVGNFIGPYQAVINGNYLEGCSVVLMTREGSGVFMNPLGSCDEFKDDSLEAFLEIVGENTPYPVLYPGYIYKLVCEDVGQGYVHIKNQLGFICVRFRREGDMLFFKNSPTVKTQDMLECPTSILSMPGIDPKTTGMSTLNATGSTSESITKDQFTCQY